MPVPVAIIVVSWNTRELLGRALDSIWPEVEAGRAAVTVVDNASTDGSAEQTASRHPWAGLVASPTNLGFGAAVNLGARRHADAAFIAPANADVELRPGSLPALIEAAARDPGAGILAPRLINPDGSTQHSVHPFPTLRLLTDFNRGRQRHDPVWADANCLEGFWDAERTRRVPWAVGAFLVVRADAWSALQGFDERQFIYAEDLDLGWRLRELGWGTRYVPDAPVTHAHAAATSQAYGPATAARWQAETYEWVARTYGRASARTLAIVNSAGAGVRALNPLTPASERAQFRAWTRLHLAGLRRR